MCRATCQAQTKIYRRRPALPLTVQTVSGGGVCQGGRKSLVPKCPETGVEQAVTAWPRHGPPGGGDTGQQRRRPGAVSGEDGTAAW